MLEKSEELTWHYSNHMQQSSGLLSQSTVSVAQTTTVEPSLEQLSELNNIDPKEKKKLKKK